MGRLGASPQHSLFSRSARPPTRSTLLIDVLLDGSQRTGYRSASSTRALSLAQQDVDGLAENGWHHGRLIHTRARVDPDFAPCPYHHYAAAWHAKERVVPACFEAPWTNGPHGQGTGRSGSDEYVWRALCWRIRAQKDIGFDAKAAK